MPADSRFYDLLSAAESGWKDRIGDDGLLSLALPLDGIDPMWALTGLAGEQTFRMLWDCAPGLSLAATGRCQQLELAGSRRFELAQRFSDLTLGRLVDGRPDCPPQARPRGLLSFSFFDQ